MSDGVVYIAVILCVLIIGVYIYSEYSHEQDMIKKCLPENIDCSNVKESCIINYLYGGIFYDCYHNYEKR